MVEWVLGMTEVAPEGADEHVEHKSCKIGTCPLSDC